MRRAGRLLLHATLLVALVDGALGGVVMVVDYLVMAVAAAGGHLPMPGPALGQVTLGVLMVLLWGGVIVAGLGALLRQCRRSLALARWVAEIAVAPRPRLVAASADVTCADGVVQVDDAAPYAFTYGIWRPRIVVSTGLVAATTHDELVAVLRHEEDHRRHRDPLKVLALRTWSAAFFLIPVVGAVLQRVLDRQELRADRAALRASGVSAVAGALLKAIGEPAAAPGTALAAMGGPALLEARVTQLETGQGPGLLAAVHPAAIRSSLPGLGLIALYGVLMYQVCMAVAACCLS